MAERAGGKPLREPPMEEVRASIRSIAEEITSRGHADLGERLGALEGRLKRKSPVRRAPVVSRPVTDMLARRIRAMAAADPEMPLQDIASALGVNIGRVSEVLNEGRG